MAAKRLPPEKTTNTASLLYQRLELIHRWYRGMVHPVTGMLEYMYHPQTNTYIRRKFSIHQIAAIWNMEVLDRFLKRQELSPIIEKSLAHYETYLSERAWERTLANCER